MLPSVSGPKPATVFWQMRAFQALVFCLLLGLLGAGYSSYLTFAGTLGWDDGFYMVLGKALAQGQGYRVISMPGAPYECALPPLYPALLGLSWTWVPGYPETLSVMKGFNVVMALVAVVATYGWVTWVGGAGKAKGWLTAGLLAVNASILLFVDVTMAEIAFIACVTITMAVCERLLAGQERLSVGRLFAVAAIAAIPSFLRSLGLALGCGVAGLLFQQRRWKALAVYLPLMGAMQVPWQIWIYRRMHSGEPHYFDYLGWVSQATGQNKLAALWASASTNVRSLLLEGLPGMLCPILPAISHARHIAPLAPVLWVLALGLCAMGLFRLARPAPRLLHWYLLAYFAVIVPFPWTPTRYAAALSPVLLYALVEGAWWLGGEGAPWRHWLVPRLLGRGLAGGVLAACAVWGVINLDSHRGLFWTPIAMRDDSLARQSAMTELVALTPSDAVVIYQNGFEVFLVSGRLALQWWPGNVDSAARLQAALVEAGSRPVFMLVAADRAGTSVVPVGWRRFPHPPAGGLALYAAPQAH